jgi:hypothetical protein
MQRDGIQNTRIASQIVFCYSEKSGVTTIARKSKRGGAGPGGGEGCRSPIRSHRRIILIGALIARTPVISQKCLPETPPLPLRYCLRGFSPPGKMVSGVGNPPDLNPIENLWAIMKAEIYKLSFTLN